jgi:UDP-N-acetyl-D-mannosaminuronate dehydrogenase
MRHYDFSHMSSSPLTKELLQSQDAVLITTDHTNVDYNFVVENSALVIDTRNATRNIKTGRDKIVQA